MNLTNAIYETLQAARPLASNDFRTANFQMDAYEEYAPNVTIRTGDVIGSQLQPAGRGEIEEENAFLDVQAIVFPSTQEVYDRLKAREKADALIKETASILFDSANLRGICDVGGIQKQNLWIRPADIKLAVCVIRIKINSR